MWNNPMLHKKPLNPYFEQHSYYQKNAEKIQAWKQGKTGYPLVDASIRALNKTGYINFRMRAMIATFFTHILKQPWWIGADYMHKQLIDAEPAINYYQWQMQSGCIGSHPLRIYNPVKQHKENDTQSKFVKKYLPEIRELEEPEIYMPWKPTLRRMKPQDKRVCVHEEEARKTREWYSKRYEKIQNTLQENQSTLLLSQQSKDRLNTQ